MAITLHQMAADGDEACAELCRHAKTAGVEGSFVQSQCKPRRRSRGLDWLRSLHPECVVEGSSFARQETLAAMIGFQA
jgi:hypothetical protein